ncbi:MAG TPA: C45 family autoproteolytic acyltransferase/hydrolase [Gammaproteobacteria bacterium]|nr:C45 family autoproteolytic acyltransferase/hydrolase [Gammaproteobacteria bacterium]
MRRIAPASTGELQHQRMERTIYAIAEPLPGTKWATLFRYHWQAYRRWFLSEGATERQLYLSSRRALQQHMPELIPTYESLLELSGGGDLAARFLSLYCPPAYMRGCSQAVWTGTPPILIRNYDYSPRLFEGTVLRTCWNGRVVAGTGDCLWGLVDGMNEDGLAVSLSFGGRRAVGKGFGVPLLLRYVLEFCSTTRDAVEALCRIPTHMSYNVTVLDRQGIFKTVFIAPDRKPLVQDLAMTTNHQHSIEWHQHARASATLERERALQRHLEVYADDSYRLVRAFLRAPLHSTAYRRGFGTLYTVVYNPSTLAFEYLWPNDSWSFSLPQFVEGTRTVDFPLVPDSIELLH